MKVRLLFAAVIAVWPAIASADLLANGLPPINTPMTGCVEGRGVRWTGGTLGCQPSSGTAPTLSGCGTGASLSANATDFAGIITTGTGIVTSCTVTFSQTYLSPLGCLAQSNSSTVALTLGQGVSQNQMVLTFALTLAGGKVAYTCFPG